MYRCDALALAVEVLYGFSFLSNQVSLVFGVALARLPRGCSFLAICYFGLQRKALFIQKSYALQTSDF